MSDGHVEDDAVADAGDADAGALQLPPELGLVLVHHRTDRAAGQRADAGADQRIAAIVAAREKADRAAGKRTQRRTADRVRNLLLARIGVGRARTQCHRGGEHHEYGLLHKVVPSLNFRASSRGFGEPFQRFFYHEMRRNADGNVARDSARNAARRQSTETSSMISR